MSEFTVSELDLLTFFEVEPELSDPNEPWIYNDATYMIVSADFSLSFSFAPAYRDLRIILKHRKDTMFELNAMSIKDISYRNEKGNETLTIELSSSNSISLRIKPGIEFQQRFRNDAVVA